MQSIDKSSEPYIQISHSLYELLLLSDFTKRELKLLLLIVRLSHGCNKPSVKLKKYDLQIIGIQPSHAGEILNRLIFKNVIVQNEATKEWRINERVFKEQLEKQEAKQIAKLRALIGKQLTSKNYQKGNAKVPKVGTNTFPKEEVDTSQNGNSNTFPKEEVLRTNSPGFIRLKEIVNNIKKSDK